MQAACPDYRGMRAVCERRVQPEDDWRRESRDYDGGMGLMTDEKTWLKPPQVETMRDACYSDGFATYLQSRNDAIIALMYDAGLRPGELVSLTTEMFHPDEPALHLPSDVQKQYPTDTSPPPTSIRLADDDYTSDTVRTLNTYLNSRWKDSLFLFPSRNAESMTTRQLRRTVKKIAVEADVSPHVGFGGRGDPKDIDPYTFRHSVAYRLLSCRDDGTTMYDVRKRLRHTSIETTEQHYDHFDTV